MLDLRKVDCIAPGISRAIANKIRPTHSGGKTINYEHLELIAYTQG
jgi:hypothetical protein